MNFQKSTKYISIFIATLGFIMFLFTAKALAASISISANVQGYCWSVTGPADFTGCNDAFGFVPEGQYSVSLTQVPSGYSLSSLGGSSNPANAGDISWVGTFTANPTPTPTPVPTVDAKANGSDGPITVPYGSTVTITWTSTNATSCSSPALGSGLPANATGTQYSYTATTSGTSSITCTGPGGTSSPDFVTVNVGPPPTPTPDAPACNFNFSPSSINLSQSTTFNWTSNDSDGQIPYSCTGNLGSGTLSGANGGPLTVVPNPTTTQSCAFTVHTSGSTKICNASITVTIPTPTPTPIPKAVDIKCGGSDTSTTVPYGGSANVSWTSGGVSNCTVSPSGWTGTSNSGISTGSLTSNRTYTITCQ